MSIVNNKMNFEEALSRLNAIVKQLESGNIKLQDAMALYDEGSDLKKHCQKKLEEAKIKITNIIENEKSDIKDSL